MKIVHAVGWYYPNSLGGTEVYVAGLCRRLRLAGHEVTVVAPLAGLNAVTEYQHEGVRVIRYPVPPVPTRNEAQGIVAARGAELMHAWLSRTRPDVFHLHSMVTGLGLHEIRAAHGLGIPTVLTHHLPSLGAICRQGGLMEDGRRPCDGLAGVRRCAACMLTVRGVPHSMAVPIANIPLPLSEVAGRIPGPCGTALGMAASTAADQAHLKEINHLTDIQVALNQAGWDILIANGASPERVVLNRLGIDHDPVRKPDASQSPTRTPVRVGYLGRIDTIKGLRELVLAIRLIPSTVPLRLEIVGPLAASVPAGFGRELQLMAAEDPRISFSDAVPFEQVPATLARFDVLCCPSTGFENGPTVALEAVAVGTPVIGSQLGGLAEIVSDDVDGRLVPAADVEALAQVLEQVAKAPAETIDRWRSSLGAVRTMNQIAADYLSLYSHRIPTAARAS